MAPARARCARVYYLYAHTAGTLEHEYTARMRTRARFSSALRAG